MHIHYLGNRQREREGESEEGRMGETDNKRAGKRKS